MPPLISATPDPWPVVDGPCGHNGPTGITADQWAAAVEAASAWLWSLSGRQFGTWTVVYRPEWTNQPPPPARRGTYYGWGWGAGFYPFAGTPLAPAARCAPHADPRVTTLPGPVVSVEEVKVDGTVLSSSAYEVNGDLLYRVDGTNWPVSQDTTLPATAPGTWQVTYTRGRPVPAGGQAAVGVLACEIAQALVPGGTCRLPGNVTNVTRQGVTISKQIDQLNLGYTGLSTVDQWARSVNPKTRPQEPAVWSPDLDPDLYPAPAIGATP